MIGRLTVIDLYEERTGGIMERHRVHVGVALLAMAVIGAVAGDAVAAERKVLGEYINATW